MNSGSFATLQYQCQYLGHLQECENLLLLSRTRTHDSAIRIGANSASGSGAHEVVALLLQLLRELWVFLVARVFRVVDAPFDDSRDGKLYVDEILEAGHVDDKAQGVWLSRA